MSPDPDTTPDGKSATPTETEIRSALEGLKKSSLSQARIAKAAKLLLDYHPILTDHMEPKDLINDAVVAILDGRRDWDRSRIDFPTFLIGVMRSLASNESRKAKETRPRYVRESDLEDSGTSDGREGFLASVPADTPTPENQLINEQDEAEADALIAIVRAQLSDDPDVLRVLELELDGVSKKAIRDRIGMESKRFWTIDRRIVRAFEAAAKWRNSHDQ